MIVTGKNRVLVALATAKLATRMGCGDANGGGRTRKQAASGDGRGFRRVTSQLAPEAFRLNDSLGEYPRLRCSSVGNNVVFFRQQTGAPENPDNLGLLFGVEGVPFRLIDLDVGHNAFVYWLYLVACLSFSRP